MKKLRYSRKKWLLSFFLITASLLLGACGQSATSTSEIDDLTSWEDVVDQGSNQEVTMLMWGGNESVNTYMDDYVAPKVKDLYGITLNRVPMDASDFVAKLLNEKKSDVSEGTADLLWINAENFKTAKEGGLLSDSFTDLLPNLSEYYDAGSSDLTNDSGIDIDGQEAIWGKAQLVLSYDSAVVENPPKTYAELLDWVKENPGKFTFPKIPDDFVGAAFVRGSFYELTGESDVFQEDMSQDEFDTLAQPVVDYFKELNPYLWNQGESFPASQAQLDELFKNGEVEMTMGFEVGKTAGLVASGVYPDTVKTYVFDTGSIGNQHYLAIPFNSTQKAAAMLVIDFLESPEAQIEKMKASVWGDMPAFDYTKLSSDQQAQVDAIEEEDGLLSVEELAEHRLPEMKATYIDWIKTMWTEDVLSES